jgi:SAM-dependent methyltransferase
MEWGAGRYEDAAAELLPAARLVVERAAVRPGERVLDLGCGTGNAALIAAEAGAAVTGVDPAERLLGVARDRAAAAGLEVEFVSGEAAWLPVANASVAAVISVFGVIFAPDAGAAAREMARVAAPDGRIVVAAWKPGGAIGEVARIRGEAVAKAAGRTPRRRFAWHDPDAVAQLLGPHGFAVEASDESIAFTAASADDFAAAEFRSHPLWNVAREVLGPRGELGALRDRALAVFRFGNEDADGFRVTSRYAVVSARRAAY